MSCLDVSYTVMVDTFKSEGWGSTAGSSGMRQWVYQTCIEWGFFQSSDSNDQPFGNMFPLSLSTQQCVDIYGLPGPNIAWTNQDFGLTHAFSCATP